MANPTWFDAKVYMANKLAQLQVTDDKGAWTEEKLLKAFEDNGFSGTEGAYKHFEMHGADENVSPNAMFNVAEYLSAKANQLNALKVEGKNWDSASVFDAIKAAGMNVWEHYDLYGSKEGINPSNAFNAESYILAKTKLMNETKEGDRADWTVAEVKAAFEANGLSALEHYSQFGQAEFKAAGKETALTEALKVTTPVDGDATFNPSTGVKTYDNLSKALTAQKDGSLAAHYSITTLDTVTVTVAQQAALKAFIAAASNATELAKQTVTYTLEDTVANIDTATQTVKSNSVVAGKAGWNINDTLTNVVAGDDKLVNDATHAYGTVKFGADDKAAAIETTVTYDNLKDKMVADGEEGITLKAADNTATGGAIVTVDASAETTKVGTADTPLQMDTFFNDTVGDKITLKYVASDKGDSVQGTAESDIIVGGKGSDLLYGSTSKSITDATTGDTISGGEGADRMYGSAGNDVIYGNAAGVTTDKAGDTNINDARYASTENIGFISTANTAFLAAVNTVTTVNSNSTVTSKIGLTNVFNGWKGDDKMYATSAADSFEYHTDTSGQDYATTKFSDLGTDTIYGFELGKDMLLINMIEAAAETNGGHGITVATGQTGSYADILIKANLAAKDATATANTVTWKIDSLTDKDLGADGTNDYTVTFTFGANSDSLTINFVDVVGTPTTAGDFLLA